MPAPLGRPRVHLRELDSTNRLAGDLAGRGAPHGTLVTAAAQTAGRGRQGRMWSTPPGDALLCSLLLRDPPPLLSLVAGVAVADVCGAQASLKWPNDVLIGGLKVAGILVQGRPQQHWAVLGIGLNVAVDPADFPAELQGRAGSLGRDRTELQPTLAALLVALTARLAQPREQVLAEIRARDVLYGRAVGWERGAGGDAGTPGGAVAGTAAGIDERGRLLVRLADGSTTALDAGEVHLARTP